jgi:hypothetical protein
MLEIKTAILCSTKHSFWYDKMTPVVLFRQRNPNGDPVDYIGQLLNFPTNDPQVVTFRMGLKEAEEKEAHAN